MCARAAAPDRCRHEPPENRDRTATDLPAAHADEIDVGGRVRTYDVHVPPGVEVDAPLVMAFHGQGGSGKAQALLSGMNSTADVHGFVVVYRDGVDRTWHHGGSEIDDLAIVDAQID